MTNRTKSEFISHCRIAAKTNFLMLLLFPVRFAHARYSSRMIDRFLNWGDHGKPKSGKIKDRCQPPLARTIIFLIPQKKKQGQFKENSSQMGSWDTLAMTTYWNRLEEKRQLIFLSLKTGITHRSLYQVKVCVVIGNGSRQNVS